ncbi:MAG: hypothetical protein IIZ03_06525, partial [Succinivibrionaceae bacterium]|nr:hypothetical protein [Succinivibrionaceae bacterium]
KKGVAKASCPQMPGMALQFFGRMEMAVLLPGLQNPAVWQVNKPCIFNYLRGFSPNFLRII